MDLFIAENIATRLLENNASMVERPEGGRMRSKDLVMVFAAETEIGFDHLQLTGHRHNRIEQHQKTDDRLRHNVHRQLAFERLLTDSQKASILGGREGSMSQRHEAQ